MYLQEKKSIQSSKNQSACFFQKALFYCRRFSKFIKTFFVKIFGKPTLKNIYNSLSVQINDFQNFSSKQIIRQKTIQKRPKSDKYCFKVWSVLIKEKFPRLDGKNGGLK